jgi:hypothetical protein
VLSARSCRSTRASGGLIVCAGLQNLGLEFLSTKRLVDKASNACVPGLNNLLNGGIGRHHDEGQIRILFVCAHILE